MKPPALHTAEMVAWRSSDHFIERVRVAGGWLYHAVYFARLDAASWGGTSMCFVPDLPAEVEAVAPDIADLAEPDREETPGQKLVQAALQFTSCMAEFADDNPYARCIEFYTALETRADAFRAAQDETEKPQES